MNANSKLLISLINEGDHFTFENNKKHTYGDVFSYATSDFLSWVSKVENFILNNYDENSGPYKMLASVDKSKFSGYYQSEFECELTKIKAAIQSCESLRPNKTKHDNYIISLIKNPIFWTIIVVVIGASYKLGYDNGNAKFDNEKIALSDRNKILIDSISILKKQSKIIR